MKHHHLREMVPAWIDSILRDWVAYMHSEDGHKRLGYPRASSFAKGQRNVSGFDDFEDSITNWRGVVADSIINSLEMPYRIAINHVYLAAVWSSPRWQIEILFPDAIAVFGKAAKTRGLV